MCGIAGQVQWGGAPHVEALEAMAQAIAHRGPDDHGLWTSGDGLCALAHRRLSIIDLSPLGRQPMVDGLTGNALVFNGEIYNYRLLRRECERHGDVFRSQSDTEVILALYRRHGERCLDHLRGMFAIALWDARAQRLLLARDRMGKKPLNYALTRDGVVFCSEIHPLSLHPAVSRDMDNQALELYLQLQAVPAPLSIYRQIRKLPPAHLAWVGRDGIQISRYWDVDYSMKHELDDEQALEAFEAELTEAVRLRMVSDVPIGALLSGGVDSSVVVALMAKLAGAPVNTFSIGFREAAFNELPYAQQAATQCGTLHHPEHVEGEVAGLLPTLMRHYGEPYADSSAVPSFHVSRVARRHVTVALNGDGGDELLGGYPRYGVKDMSIALGTRLGPLVGPDRLAAMTPWWANAKSLPARALRKAMSHLVSPEMGGLLMFAGYWNDADRARLLPPGGDPNLVPRWRRTWMQLAFAHAENPIDRMLYLDNHTYLPDDLLVKMDIASMHCGLETRSPLLDHKLVEFCAALPVRYKVRGRTTKWLLKRLATRYFPDDFVHRKKMGFGIPVAQWLRGPLRAHVEPRILDPSLMAPLQMPTIRQSWNRLLAVQDGATADAEAGRVWALLMYAQWRELVCQGLSPAK